VAHPTIAQYIHAELFADSTGYVSCTLLGVGDMSSPLLGGVFF
jgi:hypothetical protein